MVIKELTWVQVVWYYLIEILILIRGPSFLLMRQRMIITNNVVYCIIFAYLLFINVELIEPLWLNSIFRAFGTMKIIT